MTTTYQPEVRKYHPQGWDRGYWAGITKRDGAKRVTDICRHQHTTREEAIECARHLAKLRNLGM